MAFGQQRLLTDVDCFQLRSQASQELRLYSPDCTWQSLQINSLGKLLVYASRSHHCVLYSERESLLPVAVLLIVLVILDAAAPVLHAVPGSSLGYDAAARNFTPHALLPVARQAALMSKILLFKFSKASCRGAPINIGLCSV